VADPGNASAEMPEDPASVVELVRGQLEEEWRARRGGNAAGLASAAKEAVLALWDRPVRVFVPVLAARAVRETLRGARSSAGPEQPASSTAPAQPRAVRAPARRPPGGDVLLVDNRDVLHDG
jgi:hypothetical protein